MRVLLDIVHPADVLFFLNPIRRLQQAGHPVCIASRHKDVTTALLDAFELDHQVLSRAGGGIAALALELVRRDVALLRLARGFRPDVMCGFGGVAIAHVGKLLGIPSVSFYDTERAPLQHRLTLPFISHLYVPQSYAGPIARGRTTRFAGTKDCSYFHPQNFSPDRELALSAGLAPGSSNFFLRLVSWQANHDLGYRSWHPATLRQLVRSLATRGRVHVSSETPLPADLQDCAYRGPVHAVHHLLAHCDCYIGESATMAGETVLLGVPAIYATGDRRCYTDDLAARQLLWKVPDVSVDTVRRALADIDTLPAAKWRQRVADYRRGVPNLAEYVVETLCQHARDGSA